ncbi:MAG: TrmH family RNA methyltransferase [Oscillospiraceae bacterium]
MRTAECAGAHRGHHSEKKSAAGACGLKVVGKASAGALEYLPVARVSNITAAYRYARKADAVWIYGTAAEGRYDRSTRRTSPALPPSSSATRGEGMRPPRLRSSCDFKVGIPMKGSISSLNASAASELIMLYEAVRQKKLRNQNRSSA